MTNTFALFGTCRNRLGESPVWDARSQQLWWVDSIADVIRRADADGGGMMEWRGPSHIGSIALTTTGLIAACADGFYSVDTASGMFTPITCPEAGNPRVRFNDGKVDRQGRFLAGTMRVGVVEDRPAKLYRLEPDGSATVLEQDFLLANAICFSPDGGTLYFADSLQATIWAYDYAADGTVGNRRVFLDTTALGSAPDGATVDAAGQVWVALVQVQQLACVSPAGVVLRRIDVPVPFPSCPAFGGADMQTLFLTSISDAGAMRSDHPDSGRIVAITGLGVTGIPEPLCEMSRP